ncbi:MAG TPA: high-potential iron-sulfur protein [Steroidobacteraceae bacterium]|jgi:hypothetical protein
MTGRVSRRRLLGLGVAAGGAFGAAAWLWPATAKARRGPEQPGGSNSTAQGTRVNEKDSLAVALGYLSDASRVDRKASPTYQPGASCSSCSWYQGQPGDAAGGPCTFFPGKLVDAHGWCRMWNKKQ